MIKMLGIISYGEVIPEVLQTPKKRPGCLKEVPIRIRGHCDV